MRWKGVLTGRTLECPARHRALLSVKWKGVCGYTLDERYVNRFFFKSGNTDLKEVYNMILMLNILSCSGSLSISLHFLLSLLVRGLMTPRTVKERPPKPNYLWPPQPENLLCVEDFAVSLKLVFQVVCLRKSAVAASCPSGAGNTPRLPAPGTGPDWSKGSPFVSEWFRMRRDLLGLLGDFLRVGRKPLEGSKALPLLFPHFVCELIYYYW